VAHRVGELVGEAFKHKPGRLGLCVDW
jgi:hypothetical protein